MTQTPDHVLPATSCSLHERLGLARGCAAFDVNLGCSGYVYGLWLVGGLLSSRQARRALLLVGDTITKIISPADRSVVPLFGDAGTATALESAPERPAISFSLGTDGSGASHLTVPAGGFRRPHSVDTCRQIARDDGSVRSDDNLFMDGAEVFAFTMRQVPQLLRDVVEAHGWDKAAVDAWVFHQANEFMIRHLAKKAGLPAERVVVGLRNFGNTSSASIPLALATTLRERLVEGRLRLVLAGFGVGFSWAAAALETDSLVVPPIALVG